MVYQARKESLLSPGFCWLLADMQTAAIFTLDDLICRTRQNLEQILSYALIRTPNLQNFRGIHFAENLRHFQQRYRRKRVSKIDYSFYIFSQLSYSFEHYHP